MQTSIFCVDKTSFPRPSHLCSYAYIASYMFYRTIHIYIAIATSHLSILLLCELVSHGQTAFSVFLWGGGKKDLDQFTLILASSDVLIFDVICSQSQTLQIQLETKV